MRRDGFCFDSGLRTSDSGLFFKCFDACLDLSARSVGADSRLGRFERELFEADALLFEQAVGAPAFAH